MPEFTLPTRFIFLPLTLISRSIRPLLCTLTISHIIHPFSVVHGSTLKMEWWSTFTYVSLSTAMATFKDLLLLLIREIAVRSRLSLWRIFIYCWVCLNWSRFFWSLNNFYTLFIFVSRLCSLTLITLTFYFVGLLRFLAWLAVSAFVTHKLFNVQKTDGGGGHIGFRYWMWSHSDRSITTNFNLALVIG